MNTNTNAPFRTMLQIACMCLLFLATACEGGSRDPGDVADTGDAPEVQTLGFLDDYEQLSPGLKGQASLIYIDGEADFSTYSAMVIEPVVSRAFSRGQSEGASNDAPTKAAIELAESLDAALRRELAHEFELVEQPRAGALRMRTALAAKGNSHLILELELLDGATGKRVVALVDDHESAGSDQTDGSRIQVDAWAARARDRLGTFRRFDAAANARESDEAQ